MWTAKNKQTKQKSSSYIQRTDWWLPGQRVAGRRTGDEGQKVQTFSYKINKSWRCNAQYGD